MAPIVIDLIESSPEPDSQPKPSAEEIRMRRQQDLEIRDAFLRGALDEFDLPQPKRPSPAPQRSARQMPRQSLPSRTSLGADSAGGSSEKSSSASLKRKHGAVGRDEPVQTSINRYLESANGKPAQRTISSFVSRAASNGASSVHSSARDASSPVDPSPAPITTTARPSPSSEQLPLSSMAISDDEAIPAKSAEIATVIPSSSMEPCPPMHPAPEGDHLENGHSMSPATVPGPPEQVKDKPQETVAITHDYANQHIDRSSAAAILKKVSTHFFPESLPRSYDHFNAVEIFRRKLARLPGPPITFCYEGRDLDIDLNFEFVDHYKLGEWIVAVDEEFKYGCDCEGGVCDPETCLCASEGGTRVGTLNGEEDGVEFVPPYIKNDLGMTVLSPEFMAREHNHIFECSSRCSCNSRCWNRVSQEGRKVRLELFKTQHCGLGLRSPDPIYQGQFIDLYKGEIITIDESDRRLHALGDTLSYQFSLDKLTSEDYYVVDGRRYASVTRYANHSCNPNILTKTISQCMTEEKIIEIGFFALKDIPPGEELRFDYNPQIAHEKITKIDPDAVRCRCGESNCRGQLWPNTTK
ncbi:hypothetical protein KEM56_007054 [Ascosphaera pollenicola]|nr:hypothetical protein KEM56_007054 [Ascosphaera pollenicola]